MGNRRALLPRAYGTGAMIQEEGAIFWVKGQGTYSSQSQGHTPGQRQRPGAAAMQST